MIEQTKKLPIFMHSHGWFGWCEALTSVGVTVTIFSDITAHVSTVKCVHDNW